MRRRLIIIGIALVVLIIPAIVIVALVNRSPKLQNTVLKVANVNRSTLTNVAVKNANTAVVDPLAKDRAAVIFTARNFAERYGSESNQNNFQNFIDAEAFGTTAFDDALTRSITQQKLTLTTTPYRSTITKALSIKVTVLTASNANVTVSTQRQETIDRTERVYYQDLILVLLKVGNDWKINAAGWKSV